MCICESCICVLRAVSQPPTTNSSLKMAPIKVGDTIPDGTLAYFDENDELQQVSVHTLAADTKVVIFGVPGAFTPTCRFYKSSSFYKFCYFLRCLRS
ncbi:putative thioredoxin-dependent peroxiredoxin [Helianthus anomalus]